MLNAKLKQAQSLRALAENASTALSDIPMCGTRNVNRMEDIITKLVDLEAEIKADIITIVDLKQDIAAAIRRVNNLAYQAVLELRYLCFMRWPAIAQEMAYSSQHTFRLHKLALQVVEAQR